MDSWQPQCRFVQEQSRAECGEDDQEMQKMNSRVQHLVEQRGRQMEAAQREQTKLKCVEWDLAMSEATSVVYRLRCEEAKAQQAVEDAKEKLVQVKFDKANAEQIAAGLQGQRPDC